MIKNYLLIAWRNIKRNKTYAFINLSGLTLCIACSVLIFAFVTYHVSFDNFHNNKDRIYRVITEFHNEGVGYTDGIQAPAAKAMRDDYEFAEKMARIYSAQGVNVTLKDDQGDKKFLEEILYAEPEYLDILNFPLLSGNKKTVLQQPNEALISERMAKKYFGTDNVVGKLIRVGNVTDFTITGVLKDIPSNTDHRSEILLSYASLKEFNPQVGEYWGGVNADSKLYVLLKKGGTVQSAEQLFPAFNKKYFTGKDVSLFIYRLQPLKDIHFNPVLGGAMDTKRLWALGFIGLFLLMTACFNFINLATALALKRSKEVGVRKVMGSNRLQLFWQFIGETGLIILMAELMAYLFAILLLPYLNNLLGVRLSLNLFENWQLGVFLLAINGLLVFSAGSYPALVLSKFKPIMVLKAGSSASQPGNFSLRRVLVIVQFSISQILIIGAIVIASQIRHSTTSDLGYNKDAVILLPLPSDDISKMSTLNAQVKGLAGISNNSFCFTSPSSMVSNFTSVRFDNRDVDENWMLGTKDADEGYIPTFGLRLIAGRNIVHSDTTTEYVVNEAFVKKLGIASPEEIIGKKLATSRGKRKGIITGVMKDFYNASFHDQIPPLCIRSNHEAYSTWAIKLAGGNTASALASIEKAWKSAYPQDVYSYEFLDERIARFYATDQLILKIVQLFSLIAIFIGCLGLYGLVSFMAVQKTKEIGVRKVLGANIGNIIWLFGKEFTVLLIISFVIAAPVAWFLTNKYLEDFAYRINIGAGIFLITLLSSFIIASLTVGYRSIRAALANPVKSLRSE